MEDAYPLTWPTGKLREGRSATARFETTLAIDEFHRITEARRRLKGGE